MRCLLPFRTELPYRIVEQSMRSCNISVCPILTTLSLQTRQTPTRSFCAGGERRSKKLFCRWSIDIEAVRQYTQFTMGKKRKAGGRPAQKDDAPMRTKYSIEERFEDSEDEFQANRDQILLEEAPEAKRRRRVAEDGTIIVQFRAH